MSAKPATTPPARPPKGSTSSVSATEAQNNFGRVLARVAAHDVVYITRYDQPTAVVLSIERYDELTGADAAALDALTREFDEMLARMRTSEATAGFDALFEMGPAELGEAAARGTRREED